jgi:hypothetical protein
MDTSNHPIFGHRCRAPYICGVNISLTHRSVILILLHPGNNFLSNIFLLFILLKPGVNGLWISAILWPIPPGVKESGKIHRQQALHEKGRNKS